MKLQNKTITETELNDLLKKLSILHYQEYLPETPAKTRREIRCLFARIVNGITEIEQGGSNVYTKTELGKV